MDDVTKIVYRGGGVQKSWKFCVRTLWMAPFRKHHWANEMNCNKAKSAQKWHLALQMWSISSSSKVLSGVPQGTVLGPTLFLLYINDLPSYVDSPIRLFADDYVIYREIKSYQDASTLQSDINGFQWWKRDWLMDFNAEKCFVLNITRKHNPSKNKYILKGQVLQTVKTTTYLDVEISDLSWSPHVSKITKKANKCWVSLGVI